MDRGARCGPDLTYRNTRWQEKRSRTASKLPKKLSQSRKTPAAISFNFFPGDAPSAKTIFIQRCARAFGRSARYGN
jgi:hypothetical protein